MQVAYDNRALTFALDTGATNTDLYPPFASAFPDLIHNAPKTDSYKMEGVGGARYMKAATLESLRFSIGGFPTTLQSGGSLAQPHHQCEQILRRKSWDRSLTTGPQDNVRFQGDES